MSEGRLSNIFWKTREKNNGEANANIQHNYKGNYITKDPVGANHYRTKHFAGLYQTKEGRPSFIETTEKTVQAEKVIE